MPAAVFCRSPDQAAPAARSCRRLQQRLQGREEQGGAAASSSPLQPHIAATRPGQGAYLDPGSSLASRFLRQRRQRSEMQGFLADALGVELAATDSERCNRHELCPEAQEEGRRGGHLS